MTRRPKLSLEPDQQVRREPPKGFTATDRADARIQIGPEAPAPSATARSPESAVSTVPRKHRSRPSFSSQTPAGEQASPALGFDPYTLTKVLLAVGVAALSIILLKNRFF